MNIIKFCYFSLSLLSISLVSTPAFSDNYNDSIFSFNDDCFVSQKDINIEYHNLKAYMFKSNENNKLDDRYTLIDINCPSPISPVLFSIKADEKVGTTTDSDQTHFGLGTINTTGKIGFFQVSIEKATVDGIDVNIYETDNENSIGIIKTSPLLKIGTLNGFSQDGLTPSKGNNYQLKLKISPTIYSLKETNGPLVNGGELSGSLLFDFSFGS
ncbi:TPA: fimbrial protein [Proteus mirabilis]|nr:fimbrial protein [Proteus mirabilis]HEK2723802.1 fimbrial protein [Proteus mirabilis]